MADDRDRIRVLLIAEAANPEGVSVPLVGWSHAQALAKRVDAHMVTEIRNRDPILRAGLVEGRDFTAIDAQKIAAPIYQLSARLRGGTSKAWTTATAFSSLSYYYFEHLVWKRFKADLLAKRFDLVHRLTPLTPTAQSTLAKKCHRHSIPFVLGPLNGGLPWPRALNYIRSREREWLSYVRPAYKLLPSYGATRKYASAIIAGSIETYRQIPARYHEKCVYIPENAIAPERFGRTRTRKATRPIRLIFLGRLVPYKGADMLLEAAAPLIRAGAAVLEIAGDGPEMEHLRQIIARENIEAGARLLGAVPHERVGEILAECDVFAFPSAREFGGAVVIEAMAVGLVPVVIDYGGPGELVSKRSGLTIPLGNRPEIVEHLRAVLTRLSERPETIDTMSQAAVERARTLFTWDAKAAQVLEVYRWVLGQRGKPDYPMPAPDLPLEGDGVSRGVATG